MPKLARPSSYDILHTRASSSVILDVLQITMEEKRSGTDIILGKLDSRGIVASEKCGSDGKKAHIDKIIKELKTEAKHYALFNRAKNAGEDIKEVDYALRKLIFIIHAQRNKRKNGKIESTRRSKYNPLPSKLRTHTLLHCYQSLQPTPRLLQTKDRRRQINNLRKPGKNPQPLSLRISEWFWCTSMTRACLRCLH